MKRVWMLSPIFALACSDQPSREKFPGPQGRTTDTQSAEMTQAMLGGFDPLNNPFQEGQKAQPSAPNVGASAPSAAANEGGVVEGVITLAKGVSYRPGMWLYVSIRSKEGGPPLAVRRDPNPSFPYKFRLSQSDAMMADTKLEGDVDVTARLDQDGDASASVPAKVPSSGLKLELK